MRRVLVTSFGPWIKLYLKPELLLNIGLFHYLSHRLCLRLSQFESRFLSGTLHLK